MHARAQLLQVRALPTTYSQRQRPTTDLGTAAGRRVWCSGVQFSHRRRETNCSANHGNACTNAHRQGHHACLAHQTGNLVETGRVTGAGPPGPAWRTPRGNGMLKNAARHAASVSAGDEGGSGPVARTVFKIAGRRLSRRWWVRLPSALASVSPLASRGFVPPLSSSCLFQRCWDAGAHKIAKRQSQQRRAPAGTCARTRWKTRSHFESRKQSCSWT